MRAALAAIKPFDMQADSRALKIQLNAHAALHADAKRKREVPGAGAVERKTMTKSKTQPN